MVEAAVRVVCIEFLPVRAESKGRVIWARGASVSFIYWIVVWDFKMCEHDRDGLIPSLTDGETEAQGGQVTCPGPG